MITMVVRDICLYPPDEGTHPDGVLNAGAFFLAIILYAGLICKQRDEALHIKKSQLSPRFRSCGSAPFEQIHLTTMLSNLAHSVLRHFQGGRREFNGVVCYDKTAAHQCCGRIPTGSV